MTLRAVVIPVTPFQQNCSLIWCDRTMRGAVIDPGGDLETVLAEAKRHGVTLEKILLTHAHVDHAGATSAGRAPSRRIRPIARSTSDTDW